MAPDCFACSTEECVRCGCCCRGFCFNHGRRADPLGRVECVCDLCWHERASFRAIVPGLLLGVFLVSVLFFMWL